MTATHEIVHKVKVFFQLRAHGGFHIAGVVPKSHKTERISITIEMMIEQRYRKQLRRKPHRRRELRLELSKVVLLIFLWTFFQVWNSQV